MDALKSVIITEGLAEQSKKWTTGYKFTKMLPDNSFVNNEYGKIFEIETTNAYQRIKIAADNKQIDLMLKLCENLHPPYFILYVLVVPRHGHKQGRYQSQQIESINEVETFLNEFQYFFETDGRHHIWIGTVDNSGLLIYDQHNVIFSYGQLDKQLTTLRKEDFHELSFSFPVPHAHYYNGDNDKFEDKVLEYWEWDNYPLTEHDTYAD